MRTYAALKTVEYECQKCGVHFDVYFPEKPETDKDNKPLDAKCPLSNCDGIAKAVDWTWDREGEGENEKNE